MGVHYFNFGYDENADICEELTPFQLMYTDNKLNGFVWQHNAPLTGSSQYPSFLVYILSWTGMAELLKTGSDKIVYWLFRFFFLLGYIIYYVKKPKRFVILTCNSTQSLLFFWHDKTQEERESTELMN